MPGKLIRQQRDSNQERRWIVAGEHGAVDYRAMEGGRALGITLHSPAPAFDGDRPFTGCDIIEGACYMTGSALQAADLHDRYTAAGQDENIIWAELEAWYRGLLEGRQ